MGENCYSYISTTSGAKTQRMPMTTYCVWYQKIIAMITYFLKCLLLVSVKTKMYKLIVNLNNSIGTGIHFWTLSAVLVSNLTPCPCHPLCFHQCVTVSAWHVTRQEFAHPVVTRPRCCCLESASMTAVPISITSTLRRGPAEVCRCRHDDPTRCSDTVATD